MVGSNTTTYPETIGARGSSSSTGSVVFFEQLTITVRNKIHAKPRTRILLNIISPLIHSLVYSIIYVADATSLGVQPDLYALALMVVVVSRVIKLE